jgi:hypothetical protein
MAATASATSRFAPAGLAVSDGELCDASFELASEAPTAAESSAWPWTAAVFAAWLEDESSMALKSAPALWLVAPLWAEMKVSSAAAGWAFSALEVEFGKGVGMEEVIVGLPSLESIGAFPGACSVEH